VFRILEKEDLQVVMGKADSLPHKKKKNSMQMQKPVYLKGLQLHKVVREL